MGITIALDYDGTYTLDPELWADFIVRAKDAGHEVLIVTGRRPTQPIPESVSRACRVIYTHGHDYKADAVLAFGYARPDIWIDDMPGVIEDSRVLKWGQA